MELRFCVGLFGGIFLGVCHRLVNALGAAAGHGGDGFDQSGFADPGQVFQQHMPSSQNGHNEQTNLLLFAVDDFFGFCRHTVGQLCNIDDNHAPWGFYTFYYNVFGYEFYRQIVNDDTDVKKCPTPEG